MGSSAAPRGTLGDRLNLEDFAGASEARAGSTSRFLVLVAADEGVELSPLARVTLRNRLGLEDFVAAASELWSDPIPRFLLPAVVLAVVAVPPVAGARSAVAMVTLRDCSDATAAVLAVRR